MVAWKRGGAAIAMLVTVAGCGSSKGLSRKNPNFLSGRTDRESGVMTGQDNTLGYSQAEIRSAMATICTDGRLAS